MSESNISVDFTGAVFAIRYETILGSFSSTIIYDKDAQLGAQIAVDDSNAFIITKNNNKVYTCSMGQLRFNGGVVQASSTALNNFTRISYI